MSSRLPSIELGVRLYDDNRVDYADKVNLALSYGCRHFQVATEDPSILAEVRQLIEERIAGWFEMSLYVFSLSSPKDPGHKMGEVPFGILQHAWDVIVKHAKKNKAKYVQVTPDWIIKKLALADDALNKDEVFTTALANIVAKASSNRLFVCLENEKPPSIYSSLDRFELILNEVSNTPEAHWLKIALNTNNMTTSGLDLEGFFTALDPHIAITTFSGGSDHKLTRKILGSTLKYLYWLPYSQRPFILTNTDLSGLDMTLRSVRLSLSQFD